MAIAHDAQTRFPTTDGPSGTNSVDTTTGDRTFTHNPVGTPAGVVVVINSDATAAPVTGVLYAGVAMTLVQTAQDTTEAGSVRIYTLTDQEIPTDDPATVTLQGCTSAGKWVTCSTVTSATGLTTVNGSNKKDTTTATNPTLSVVTTATTLLYGALHGGAASPGSYAAGSGYTAQFNNDYGTKSARSERRTSTVAAGTITYNFTYATSDDYCIAAVALAELIVPTSTPVARISLASHGEPSERTTHSIKIRARTTSGSTGVIKAALYEGSTNRSGDLTSSVLTNALADYTLAIPDASAANITDYSDLEIRIWGYDAGGNALVFEVADVYVELPTAGVTTYYGVVAQAITFTKAVAATKQTFGITATAFTFTKVVSGTKKTFGQVLAPFVFTKAVSGIKQVFGQVVAPFVFIKAVSGTKKTFGQVTAPFVFVKAVSATKKTFGQTAFAITNSITTAGNRLANTLYGVVAFPIIFTKGVSGTKKTFGQVVASFIFVKNVTATKKTFGQIVAAIYIY